jgi:hypothetical protein
MSGSDASYGEMPGFPFSRRPAPELDESLLDALLTGQSLPPDASGPAQVMADMLASLAEPGNSGALAGESAARLAFARAASPAGISPAVPRPASAGRRPARLTARLAAALVAVAVGLGGVAAAFADVLPARLQDLAHQTIGAPGAHRPAPRLRSAPSMLCTA